jgi:hypothetical protein
MILKDSLKTETASSDSTRADFRKEWWPHGLHSCEARARNRGHPSFATIFIEMARTVNCQKLQS